MNSVVSRIKELQEMLNSWTLKYGLLQQIFIPKSKLEDYAYKSGFGGEPKRFTTLRSDLNKLETGTLLGLGDLHYLQARVILRKDIFGDPKKGAKIYTYHHVPQNIIKEYKSKLLEIVGDIFDFWSKQHRAELEKQFPGKNVKEHYELYKAMMVESKLKKYMLRTKWPEEKAERGLAHVLIGIQSKKEEVRADALKVLQNLVGEGFGITLALKTTLKALRDSSPAVRSEAYSLFKVLAKKGVFKSVRRYGPRMAKQGLLKAKKAAPYVAVATYGALLARAWFTGNWDAVNKIHSIIQAIGGYGLVGAQKTWNIIKNYGHWIVLLDLLFFEGKVWLRRNSAFPVPREEKNMVRAIDATLLAAILFRELNLRDILKLPAYVPFSKEFDDLIYTHLGNMRDLLIQNGIAVKDFLQQMLSSSFGSLRSKIGW